MTARPLVGLALMLEDDFLAAALPLFEDGSVEVLEWSFDTGWGRPVPAWAQGLLQHYSVQGCLLGHGVSLSPLSARREDAQRLWLQRAALETARMRYRHVSEHLGIMSAGRFDRAAPLPQPREPAVVRAGRDALTRLAETTGLPVGLENLALALSPLDVEEQGELLDSLLEPVRGFLVLDLHNLWCQAVNFGRDALALLERLPLARVRELHVSGGSWSSPRSALRPFRRDTHDGQVPEEVHALVIDALSLCPGVEAVILERLGGTLRQPEDAVRLRDDLGRLHHTVRAAGGDRGPRPSAPPRRSLSPEPAVDLDALARFQAALLEGFDRGASVDDLIRDVGPLAPSPVARGWLAAIEPRCAEVATELVRKWGRRRDGVLSEG